MGVIVTGRDYRNGYRAEIVDWLLGNTGDWQNLTIVCRLGVEKMISTSSSVELQVGNIVKLTDGSEWSNYGFDVGDTIFMTCPIEGEAQLSGGGTATFSGTISWNGRTITQIQGDEIVISGSDITAPIPFPDFDLNTAGAMDRLPFQSGKAWTGKSMIIYADKKPQGIVLEYGHLTNDNADSGTLGSFIDGTFTRLACLNTDTITAWTAMEKMIMQSGMSVESASWNYWGKIGTHFYQYALSINFMISSFMEDLNNFETMTAPSQVFDASSLTDNFRITGYPEWNNPNSIMKNDLKATKRLGNTGWFNENFNGLENEFSVQDVQYFDVVTGAIIDKLSYGSETRVKAKILGVQNLADGLSKFGLGFIWLPEDEDLYKNKETAFHKNTLVSTCGEYGSGVFPLSNIINFTTYNGFTYDNNIMMKVRNVRFMNVGGVVEYEAILSPTTGFKNLMNSLSEAERNYALWVSCADRQLVTNFSNRVSLLLDYNKMEIFIPPVGEWSPMDINFYEHPQDGTENLSGGCSVNDMIVEDDILAKIDFNVDITKEIPNAIEFAIEMENQTTGQKYELQSYKVDLSAFPTDGLGVPQWNYDAVRGFKLQSGNNKNWVKVKRNSTTDVGNSKGYVAFYGFKIRWEDWIARTGVPSAFFDAIQANNGFNNDWFQYLNKLGWKMNFTVYLESTLDGNPVKYVNSKELMFRDYNSNLIINKTWNFFRESDGALINAGVDPVTGHPLGVLLNNEQVRVQTIFERITGTWSSIADVYGLQCLEVDQGAGQMQFRQLSSIWGSEPDNPLIPLTGETLCNVTLLSPTEISVSCLVEPSLLQDATRFKHSARIGCKLS